jgi:hypothetical protein
MTKAKRYINGGNVFSDFVEDANYATARYTYMGAS